MSVELILAIVAIVLIVCQSLGLSKWFHWGWMGAAIAFALLLF